VPRAPAKASHNNFCISEHSRLKLADIIRDGK
jgi:hypothetical protein